MPISLSSFSLSFQPNSSGIALNWTTSSEENFDYFEIQRAGSDGEFQVIETVKGNGYSTEEISYAWSDENPKLGMNYYRLESVDFDGYRETFPAKYVLFEPENRKISIQPTQVTNHKITLKNTFGETFSMKIYNLNGHLMHSLTGYDNQIELSNLKPGLYLATYNVNGLSRSEKIIIK